MGYLKNKKAPHPMTKGVRMAAIKNDTAGTREAIDSSANEFTGYPSISKERTPCQNVK